MYSHTQIGWVTIIGLVGALIVIGVTAQEMGPGSPGRPFVTATLVLFMLMLPLMGSLTVTVDEFALDHSGCRGEPAGRLDSIRVEGRFENRPF